MATTPWSIPTGKAITGATYIKDTDDNIAATLEDLVDWCNNSNGTYNDYTLTGLRTDFLTKTSAQTITAVTTVDTLGAIDFTGGQLRIGGVAVTSTAAELNILDGVTSTTAELNILDGVTATTAEINVLDGYTGSVTELNYLDALHATGVTSTEFDYLDGVTSNIQTQFNSIPTLASGTYSPSFVSSSNVSSYIIGASTYSRVGNIVTVGILLTVYPTASATTTTLEVTEPIGTCSAGRGSATAIVGGVEIAAGRLEDSAAGNIKLQFKSLNTSAHIFLGTMQYLVV